MKAKEYYEKYRHEFFPGGVRIRPQDAAGELAFKVLNEFLAEVEFIAKNRNVKTSAAWKGVFDEVNQKWNAVVARFEKDYGSSPLVRNGFLNVLKRMAIYQEVCGNEREGLF